VPAFDRKMLEEIAEGRHERAPGQRAQAARPGLRH
jgi:hypothetical protein